MAIRSLPVAAIESVNDRGVTAPQPVRVLIRRGFDRWDQGVNLRLLRGSEGFTQIGGDIGIGKIGHRFV